MDPVIGIDLGTTFSCVAVYDWERDAPVVIGNRQGHRTTPSMVSYFRGAVLVGDGARSKAGLNPAGTIYNSKRFIGRRFADLRKGDLASWPFRVVGDEHGLPRIAISAQDAGQELALGATDGDILVSAEEVAAMVLNELREAAERHLSCEVSRCVITVPAYFSAQQKQATRDAGEIAGLEVLGVLAEPTAAALAYGLDEKTHEGDRFRAKVGVDGWHILVFDLGGGTLDVCVLRLDGRGGFTQCAVRGDSHLGGEDFDTRLAAAVEGRLAAEFAGVELTFKTRRRLRQECERVKRMLSAVQETTLDAELQGIDVCYDVSRGDFEGACADLFDRCLAVTLDAVRLARLDAADIDEVVLVGGSSRIPKLRAMLQSAFPGRQLWDGINPDEAVALGAATYAATQALAALDDTAVDIPPPPPSAPPTPAAAAAKQQPSKHVLQQPLTRPPPPPSEAGFESVPPTPFAGSVAGGPGAPTPYGGGGAPPAMTPKVVKMPAGARPPVSAGKGPSVPPTPTAAAGGGAPKPPVVVVPPKAPVAPKVAATAQKAAPQPPTAAALAKVKAAAGGAPKAGDIVLSSVAPHTLGIALANGDSDPLITQGTPLPVTCRERYTTQKKDQPVVTVKIVEGDATAAASNRVLGKFNLKVPPAPAGEPQIVVKFTLSAEGILSVSAKDEDTGHRHAITVDGSGTMDAGDRARARSKVAKKREGKGQARKRSTTPPSEGAARA